MKFETSDSTRVKGEIFECIPYESNTGLHWSYCYYFDEKYNSVVIYQGTIRKLKTIALIEPMVYEDVFKPIPREGKNVVILPLEKYKKLQESLLLLMRNILVDKRNLVLYCDENIAEVFLAKFYDYRIQGLFIDNQSNLEFYWVNTIPRTLKMHNATRIEISKHRIEFSVPVKIGRSERLTTSRYDIQAVLIKIEPGTEIRISHPEHGEKTIQLKDYRITNLLALHISSRYVE